MSFTEKEEGKNIDVEISNAFNANATSLDEYPKYNMQISSYTFDEWEDENKMTPDQIKFMTIFLKYFHMGAYERWFKLHNNWQNYFSKHICKLSGTMHTCDILYNINNKDIKFNRPFGYYRLWSKVARDNNYPPRIIKVNMYKALEINLNDLIPTLQIRYNTSIELLPNYNQQSGGNFNIKKIKKKLVKDNKPEKKLVKDNKPEKKLVKDNKQKKPSKI